MSGFVAERCSDTMQQTWARSWVRTKLFFSAPYFTKDLKRALGNQQGNGKCKKNWSLQKPQNGLSRIFFCKGHRLGLGLRYRPDVVIPSYPAMFPSNKAWQGTKNVPINKLFNTSTAMLLVLRNLVVINCIHIMVVTAHVVEQRIPIKNVFIVNMLWVENTQINDF